MCLCPSLHLFGHVHTYYCVLVCLHNVPAPTVVYSCPTFCVLSCACVQASTCVVVYTSSLLSPCVSTSGACSYCCVLLSFLFPYVPMSESSFALVWTHFFLTVVCVHPGIHLHWCGHTSSGLLCVYIQAFTCTGVDTLLPDCCVCTSRHSLALVWTHFFLTVVCVHPGIHLHWCGHSSS